MENTNIPEGLMLTNKQRQNPQGDKWILLCTNNWVNDFGLKKLFINLYGERHGSYYFTEKSRKKLWDLILYIDTEKAIEIVTYYEFPDPQNFEKFIKWVYNWVAPPMKYKLPKE